MPKKSASKKITKLADLPYRKRPGSRQLDNAKKVKRIAAEPKRIARSRAGRKTIDLGEFPAGDIPGAAKDYRLRYKEDFASLIRFQGQVLGRTHFASHRTQLPEAMLIRLLGKYGLKDTDPLELSIISYDREQTKGEKRKAAKQKAKADKTSAKKKAVKKSAKKQTEKKPAEVKKRRSPSQKLADRVKQYEKEQRALARQQKRKDKRQ